MCGIPESEIEKGICKKCGGKRVIINKGKKQKCTACKGTGFKVDVIY